ncbi:MBL fold metallo-hydrolase [Verticiella sediminum]|uniref:MBL fold metallo-hydrolase n=1 Tax=Verticiella sediminum TaxID=1247510 RepID=A0A556AIX7_9BURK|nr:MBL fold metallo-hydrolase [Verticiella sediminum]TSH92820.1 MBL fold metallo-hydrolase [Verticiella sediminum]
MSQPAPRVEPFYDATTGTYTYVLHETGGGACAIVDPVLDFDPKAARTSTAAADRVLRYVREHGLQAAWLLETHAHADHLSAAHYLRERLGGRIAIGAAIRTVQAVFGGIYHPGERYAADGREFDHLFGPDETFAVGRLTLRALHVPGHTPADMAYAIEDGEGTPTHVFVGDTLFMPDVGSARADFPGGDAHALYHSARRLLALPPATRLYMCHDYPPPGREPRHETSVAEQRASNIHLHDGVDEAGFVAMRRARDATLGMPTLILPAIQVNIRAGELPAAEANGVRYLRIPMNLL